MKDTSEVDSMDKNGPSTPTTPKKGQGVQDHTSPSMPEYILALQQELQNEIEGESPTR